MSRPFERGYTLVFGVIGEVRRYMPVILLALPLIQSLLADDLALYPNLLIIYMTTVTTSWIIVRKAAGNHVKGRFGITFSLYTAILSQFVDLMTSVLMRRAIAGIGVVASMPSFSIVVFTLESVRHDNTRRLLASGISKSLPCVITTQLASYMLIGSPSPLKACVLDVIGLLTAAYSSYFVTRSFSIKYGGLGVLRMLSAYLYAALFGYSGFLEQELLKESRRRDLTIHVFVLKGESQKTIIVIPDVHAGPLSNVGGGFLVGELVKALRPYATNIIYLHGVGSHELDPVTYDDTRRIVERVVEEVKSIDDNGECQISEPFQIVTDRYRLTLIPLCGKTLAIVSRLRKASDDLPLPIMEVLDRRFGLGIGERIILVDGQNNYQHDNTWDEADIEELGNTLLNALKVEWKSGTLRHYAFTIPRIEFGPFQFEICENGVMGLVLEAFGKRALIISIDGNNAHKEFVESVRKAFQGSFDIVEVVTTDNHRYTGLTHVNSTRGYSIVGDLIKPEILIDRIRHYLKRGILEETKVVYRKVVVEDVRVVGESFWGIAKSVEKGVRDWKRHFVNILVVPIILSTSIALIA